MTIELGYSTSKSVSFSVPKMRWWRHDVMWRDNYIVSSYRTPPRLKRVKELSTRLVPIVLGNFWATFGVWSNFFAVLASSSKFYLSKQFVSKIKVCSTYQARKSEQFDRKLQFVRIYWMFIRFSRSTNYLRVWWPDRKNFILRRQPSSTNNERTTIIPGRYNTLHQYCRRNDSS